MFDIPDIVLFLIGLPILLFGAELLVRHAVKLASATGRSRLAVGLTIAAFGTSAPELAIGVTGVLKGSTDVGLGNIIGSNTFNILFVLGLAALLRPIVVTERIVWRDVPILLGISLLFLALALDGSIGTVDAVVLALLLIAFLIYVIRESRDTQPAASPPSDEPRPPTRIWLSLTWIVLSLGALVLGSRWMVIGALGIASDLGISELLTGLTIVAVGTSLPEIATTIAAIRTREHDLAVGNVLGSCIFNLLAVPSVMALLTGGSLWVAGEAMYLDLPVMIGTVIVCLPIFLSDHKISRQEGVLFLAYYCAYALLLYLEAVPGDDWSEFRTSVGWLLLPMIVITVIMITYRALKYRMNSNRNGARQ